MESLNRGGSGLSLAGADTKAEASDTLGKRNIVLAVLLASYSLVYFHRTMSGVMEAEIASISVRYGYDPALYLSLLSSAYFYAYSLSQFVVGSLIDYYGIKRVGSIFLFLLALGTLLMMVPDSLVMILGRVVVGFMSVAAFLSYQRSLSLYYRTEEQVRATALALVAGNLTAAIATYPLRRALDSIGLNGTLTLLAAFTLLLSAVVYLASADTRSGGSLGEYSAKTRGSLRKVVSDKHSWGVSLGALATYGTGLSFQSSWGQILLSKAFSLDKVEVSFYLLMLATVFMASCPIAGYLSDKVIKKRKPFLVASSVLMAFSWLLLLASSISRSILHLSVALVSLGVSLGPHIVISVMIREAHERTVAATSVAFMNTVLFLGTAFLNSILPQLDYRTAVVVSAALSAIGGILVQLLTRETYT
ncbi:MAG: MFS transporter [Sulfolobales archaeon]